MNAAEMLRRALNGTQGREPEPVVDEEEWEARRKAEAEAPTAPQTTAGVLHAAIAGSSAAMPLNGASVLRAALGGGQGTINGGAAE
jgi:hypothetical protein